ncbi:NHL domain-containing protein [Heracleum sosnowskyi]|uniref:NHL domain-containing protein n=1 Tax=Heracleum sosnowskyi TaxID=360622 RepID=A0AAD8HYW6_9APIA|nr:NHL domain-containing protein [Heracleum sosnowskyi]
MEKASLEIMRLIGCNDYHTFVEDFVWRSSNEPYKNTLTIVGGKSGKGGGHVDGRSEDAKFSSDFDVVYIGSSCSLLVIVIDTGYKAIREIQLPFDDYAYQYNSGFPLAGFFGYMLALLQRRVGSIVSSQNDQTTTETSHASVLYQKPLKLSVRPPLIPNEDEQEKQEEEGFIASLGKLISSTGASAVEILGGIFPGLRKKHQNHQLPDQQEYQQEHKYSNTWPVQDIFVIPDEEEPPSIDTRTPTPRKTYPFMSQDVEKMQQFRQCRKFYSGLDGESQQQHDNLMFKLYVIVG